MKVVVDLKLADGQPTCLAFSLGGHYLVMGTDLGKVELRRVDRATGTMQIVRVNERKDERKVAASSCAVSVDGAMAAGYSDGTVDFVSADGARYPLAERVVHACPVEVRELRFEPSGAAPQWLIALGDWQLNNCVHPGLPGQAIRLWELPPNDPQRVTPVSVAWFPNQPIAGLGAMEGSRLNLLTNGTAVTHKCLGCSRAGESAGATLDRLPRLAEERGARLQSGGERFERRYGFTLN